jgi:hypothetical protein
LCSFLCHAVTLSSLPISILFSSLFLNSISKLVLNTKLNRDLGPQNNVFYRGNFAQSVFPLECISFLQHDACRELLQRGLHQLTSSYFSERIERTSANSRTSQTLPRIQNRHFINTDKALHINIHVSAKQATQPIKEINAYGLPDMFTKHIMGLPVNPQKHIAERSISE